MNETIAIAEDTIDIENPQKLYGSVSLAMGTMVFLLGLMILIIAVNSKSIDISNSIIIILSIITIILGFSKIISGSFASKKLWVPLHAPMDFNDLDSLYNSLKSGEINVYKINRSISTEIFRLFGSRNVYYLRGKPNIILKKIGNRIIKYFYSIVIIIIISQIFTNVTTIFYIFLIVILILCIIINMIIGLSLIPKNMPSAFRVHKSEDIQGGHPKKIYRILIDGLKNFHYDYPKRFVGNEPDAINEGVTDTGITQGDAFIETQPTQVENDFLLSAKNSMISGYIIWFLGFFFMLFQNKISFIYLNDIALPITGILMVIMGNSLIKDSQNIYNLFYFKSKIIYSELKGEYYQSDVGVGKSIKDSLQSERRGVLSDIRIEHYIATVYSVSHTLDSNRDMISFEKNAKFMYPLLKTWYTIPQV